MINNAFKKSLEDREFVVIVEIAVKHSHSSADILQQARSLYERGVDVVAFSDNALAESEFVGLSQLLRLNVFSRLPQDRTLVILKTRDKEDEKIDELYSRLKQQKIQNLFIVTGDQLKNNREILNNSLSVISKVSKDFFVGAVAHPQIKNIPHTTEKIKAGAEFLIVQASYNLPEWEKWMKEIKRQNIYKKVPIIAAVIPLVSPRTISTLKKIKDVSFSESTAKEFTGLDKEEMRYRGVKFTRKMINLYKNAGIFSGVYIYSKLPEVVSEILQVE